MLQKYLQLFERAFEKLTSLGGSNSTWSDYFTTVGTEFLVLLLGIVYIVAILAIIFIPIFGNRKVVQKIAKNDAYKRHRNWEQNGMSSGRESEILLLTQRRMDINIPLALIWIVNLVDTNMMLILILSLKTCLMNTILQNIRPSLRMKPMTKKRNLIKKLLTK